MLEIASSGVMEVKGGSARVEMLRRGRRPGCTSGSVRVEWTLRLRREACTSAWACASQCRRRPWTAVTTARRTRGWGAASSQPRPRPLARRPPASPPRFVSGWGSGPLPRRRLQGGTQRLPLSAWRRWWRAASWRPVSVSVVLGRLAPTLGRARRGMGRRGVVSLIVQPHLHARPAHRMSASTCHRHPGQAPLSPLPSLTSRR